MNAIRHLSLLVLAGLLASARAEVEGLSPESEIWNAGVAAYEAGDVTNALDTLRPLEGSKSHGARVAEIVSAAEFAAARQTAEDDLDGRLKHLEAATTAAQTALRAAPADERRRQNLAAASADVAGLRETKRIQALRAAAGKGGPLALMKKSLATARTVLADSGELTALSPADRVAKADSLERRARGLVDTCLLLQAAATEQQGGNAPAEALSVIGKLRDLAETSAQQLGDLHPEAEASAALVEREMTEFYRVMLDSWSALDEDLTSQSNACRSLPPIGTRSWQVDALAYTKVFRARFDQWVQQYEQSRQADTNAPPFTAEMRRKVDSLAEQLEDVQTDCVQKPDAAKQEKALDLIRQIMALRPRSPNQNQQNQDQQQQQQDQQQESQQQQQQKKDDSSAQDRKDGQKGNEDQDGQGKDDERQGEEEKEDEKESSAGEDEKEEPKDEKPGQQGKEGDEKESEEKESRQAKAAEAEESEQENADKDLLMRVLERSAENKGKNKGRSKRPRTGSNRDW